MRQMNVQIVDDDPDFAESMADIVENEGHNVIVAHSGEEALVQKNNENIDITFMDVKMPGMDGVETFKAMRDVNPAPKVVMMTAFTLDSLINEALENGALGIMNKPLDIGQLNRVLANMNENMFVLVVDDDPDFAHSISDVLRRNGYTVAIYTSGHMALGHIIGNGVDVLIVDVRLQDIDAVEITEKIRSHKKNLPTIVVTGYQEEEKRVSALNIDTIEGILTKPFEPEILLSLLDEIKKNKASPQ